MTASDSELAPQSGSSRVDAARPSTAPEPRDISGGESEEGRIAGSLFKGLSQLDLETVTAEVIALFQAGKSQEALEAVVLFSNAARDNLGRTHPTYINAIATCAALVDHMGNSEEAAALMREAEDLHEELQMEAMADELDEQLGEPSESSGTEEEEEGEEGETSEERRAATAPARSSGIRSTGRRRGRDGDAEEADSDGSEGDVDGGMGWNDSEDEGKEDEDVDDEGIEAEAITKLTFEVNNLLEEGNPEEAAKLLTEAEGLLIGEGADMGSLSGVAKAALHTLWAAVLDDVGEEEKARALYDEAQRCLEEEAFSGSETRSSSSGDGSDLESFEDDEDYSEDASETSQLDTQEEYMHDASKRSSRTTQGGEGQEHDVVGTDAPVAQQPTPPTPPSAVITQERAPDLVPAAAPPSSFFLTGDEGTAAGENAAAQARSSALAAESSAQLPLSQGGTSPSLATAAVDTAKATSPIAPSEEAARAVTPLQPKEPPPAPGARRGRRPPPLAPQAPKAAATPPATATKAAATLPAPVSNAAATPPATASKAAATPPAPVPKAAARTGGGFGVAAAKVSAPSKKAPAKKAKAKAKRSAAVAGPEEPEPNEADADETLPDAEDPALPADETPLSAEEQAAEVSLAIKYSDHFLGLFNFEKAADHLEEQLDKLSSESSPHRYSDLHLDVLRKYGGILWWDGDPEGAIDAFTAADEVLQLRTAENPGVRRMRAEVWAQLAQVYRGCGDLEEADQKLSDTVRCLSELMATGNPPGGASECGDLLREAQAALGQVCVQRKDYSRAEQMYMYAFSPDDGISATADDAGTVSSGLVQVA